jgi:REP element-mobilizing transposase RayT
LNNLEVFGAVLKFCDLHEDWQTLAAVVMPDHFHALVRPQASRDAKITQYSAGLKRFVRRETNATWKWQDGVFDRLLRRNESAESK